MSYLKNKDTGELISRYVNFNQTQSLTLTVQSTLDGTEYLTRFGEPIYSYEVEVYLTEAGKILLMQAADTLAELEVSVRIGVFTGRIKSMDKFDSPYYDWYKTTVTLSAYNEVNAHETHSRRYESETTPSFQSKIHRQCSKYPACHNITLQSFHVSTSFWLLPVSSCLHLSLFLLPIGSGHFPNRIQSKFHIPQLLFLRNMGTSQFLSCLYTLNPFCYGHIVCKFPDNLLSDKFRAERTVPGCFPQLF